MNFRRVILIASALLFGCDRQLQPFVSLTVSQTHAAPGDSITLSWNTSGATRVELLPGIGDVDTSGSTTVIFERTTTYELRSTTPDGTLTDTKTIVAAIDLKAHVVDLRGKAMPGVWVTANDFPSVQSDSVGHFSIARLPLPVRLSLQNPTFSGPRDVLYDGITRPGLVFPIPSQSFAGTFGRVRYTVEPVVATPAAGNQIVVQAFWSSLNNAYEGLPFLLETPPHVHGQSFELKEPSEHGEVLLLQFEMTPQQQPVRWIAAARVKALQLTVGAEMQLGTVALAPISSRSVTFNSTAPAERTALRFQRYIALDGMAPFSIGQALTAAAGSHVVDFPSFSGARYLEKGRFSDATGSSSSVGAAELGNSTSYVIPPEPGLLSPADGATVTAASNLSWAPPGDSICAVNIKEDIQFNAQFEQQIFVAGTELPLAPFFEQGGHRLEPGKTYRWSVGCFEFTGTLDDALTSSIVSSELLKWLQGRRLGVEGASRTQTFQVQ